jgi:hypothetical protein
MHSTHFYVAQVDLVLAMYPSLSLPRAGITDVYHQAHLNRLFKVIIAAYSFSDIRCTTKGEGEEPPFTTIFKSGASQSYFPKGERVTQ